MVTEQKFNELVESTTKYLQDLMNRVIKLEAELTALKKEKKGAAK